MTEDALLALLQGPGPWVLGTLLVLILLFQIVLLLRVFLGESSGGTKALASVAGRLQELRDRTLVLTEGQSRGEQRQLQDSAQTRQELAAGLAQQRQALMGGFSDLRQSLERGMAQLREGNEKKLEEMRVTVDEKLQATLERRLGESFQQVSQQLEQVYKGLGDMQQLAAGVGDLKKVLTNVKARGTWGETQLGMILEEILAPGQYSSNVAVRPGSAERVEFAIRLPGPDESSGGVWLPVDAKFPKEDYERLVDALEAGDPEAAEIARRALDIRILSEAKSIQGKYIEAPYTTDFGILFLPTEGLYAEVLRRPGLAEGIQRDQRIIIAGPSTFAALLNSLQMGFRTLAIQKQSGRVWEVLGKVKSEFGRFGDLLDKTHKKLQETANTIDDASRRSRAIERQLRAVQELPNGGGAGPAEGVDSGLLENLGNEEEL